MILSLKLWSLDATDRKVLKYHFATCTHEIWRFVCLIKLFYNFYTLLVPFSTGKIIDIIGLINGYMHYNEGTPNI